MNIWVAEYKDDVTGGMMYDGVFLNKEQCEGDHTHFDGTQFVRAVEFVPEEEPKGKMIDRVKKDNFFLHIEKDSLQRFISKRGLLYEYRKFAEADIAAQNKS